MSVARLRHAPAGETKLTREPSPGAGTSRFPHTPSHAQAKERPVSDSTPASVGAESPPAEGALVSVRNLTKYFPITRGIIFQKEVGRGPRGRGRLLRHLSRARRSVWSASPGCGKSTTARLVMRLLDSDLRQGLLRGPDITKLTRATCGRSAARCR